MGLVDYGSGSDDSDSEQTPVVKAPPKQEPKTVKRPPKKIGIALPALSAKRADDDKDRKGDEPPAKKARVGAGKSSLLSMLPTSKSTKPVQQPSQRVLGGGSGPGLVFSAGRPQQSSESFDVPVPAGRDDDDAETSVQPTEAAEPGPSRPSLLPPSLQKRKANISLEETPTYKKPPIQTPPSAPAVDFFSLGSTKPSLPSIPSSSSKLPSIPSISSAPSLSEFTPPEPSPYDAYPGYYQLPSGAWAAHDPEYFDKFAKKWKQEYDAHVRALEKGTVKGFEGMHDAPMQEVDPVLEMERAKIEVKEREERKALTKGTGAGPSEPKMKITAAKMSGVARSRHQLATLLKDAYENRELLEERIAEGRRNRKEAGNKYGF